MTPDRLAQIRARLAAATPGPWVLNGLYSCQVVDPRAGDDGWLVADCGMSEGPDAAPANAVLIAAAPTDLADLLAEVDRLTARVAEVERARAGDVARIAASEATGEEFVQAVLRRGVRFSDGEARLKAEARDIAASEARLALTKAADAIERGDWRDAPLPPDPRDARIAELEAEVASLRAVADTVTVRPMRKPVPLAVGQVRLDPDPRRTGDARKVTITGLDAPSFYSGCSNPSAWVSRRGRPSRISVAKLERWAIVPADTVTGGGSR